MSAAIGAALNYAVGVSVAVAASNDAGGDDPTPSLRQWLSERWEAQKRGVWLAGKRIGEAVSQGLENAKDNWNARRDPIHQALDDRFSVIGGPLAIEFRSATRAFALEGGAAGRMVINAETNRP